VLPNVQASPGPYPSNETPIAANPANSAQLLTGANDYNCPSLQGFYTSGDAGQTWSHTCLGLLPGAFGEGDPVVGYDLNGTAYAGGIDASFTEWDIALEKSTDNGTTWSAPVKAVGPLFAGGVTDKPWLTVDTNSGSPYANSLYVSVTQFDPSSNSAISLSYSRDGGNTWSMSVVDPEQFYPWVDQFSDVAVAPDGTVYVSWMRCLANGSTGDCGGTTASLLISKSTDGGATWSAPSTVASVNLAPDGCSCAFYGSLPNTAVRVSEIPSISVSPAGGQIGRVYAAYYNWTGSYMQVRVSRSSDGGTTWDGGTAMVPGDTHDQFFPWLSVNQHGFVGVSWMDRSVDPNNVNYAEFASRSTDGGNNYTGAVQIATAISNPFNDGFGGFFLGDYTGNVWSGKTGNTLYASWADTRNGFDGQDYVGGYAYTS
jgi:hypothetical protein